MLKENSEGDMQFSNERLDSTIRELYKFAGSNLDLLEEAMQSAMHDAQNDGESFASKERIISWINFHRERLKKPA